MFVGAFALVSFPLGVLIGYLWRDRISRARRDRERAARRERERLGLDGTGRFQNARSPE
jgi:hypothetical protein